MSPLVDDCDESPKDLFREKMDWEIGMKVLLAAGMMDALLRKDAGSNCSNKALRGCVSLVLNASNCELLIS